MSNLSLFCHAVCDGFKTSCQKQLACSVAQIGPSTFEMDDPRGTGTGRFHFTLIN